MLESTPPVLNPNTAPLGVEEEDDDYEPDFYAAEDTEQILNKLDSAPADLKPPEDALELKAFSLPTAPELNADSAAEIGKLSITQLVEQMKTLDDPSTKRPKPGFNRFASSFGDRDSAVTLLIRLVTRSHVGAEEVILKKEGEDSGPSGPSVSLSNHIRDILHGYIVEDFRKRIDVAVAWLCEEWLNDRLHPDSPPHYEKLVLKLLDGFLPYLHRQDKILVRFLAEVPELTEAILSRVKQICRDPTVVGLALTSLLYIIMMKPPARELALDTLEAIWGECKLQSPWIRCCHSTWTHDVFVRRVMLTMVALDEDARPTAEKYLTKYRPDWRERQGGMETSEETSEETPAAQANGAITA